MITDVKLGISNTNTSNNPDKWWSSVVVQRYGEMKIHSIHTVLQHGVERGTGSEGKGMAIGLRAS